MKLLLFLITVGLQAQATFTQGQPATAATPAKLSTIAGTGTSGITCPIVGDTFPATKVTIGPCTVGAVTIPSFVIPANAGTLAFTYQFNAGTSAVTVILQVTSLATITVTSAVNGAAPVGGQF